jgi:beta-glucosidase
VHLTAGQSREISFELGHEHLRMLDENMRWIVEPGEFRVMIGASAKDIRLRGHFTVR